MRGFLVELAKVAGTIARQHYATVSDRDVSRKGDRDYVSHVDRMVEDTLVRRIRSHYPDHQIMGEEGSANASQIEAHRPLWIIDPIDGTTNFIHGIPAFAVSIAFSDRGETQHGIVYDPLRDEAFVAERGAGTWLNGQRVYTSGCASIERALLATAVPFRFPVALDDSLAVFGAVQRQCDDQRRGGSAALDLAYTAVGRLDGYYELGIYPWDTAAGELLVRCAGGVATDYAGQTADLLHRRSLVAGASAGLHAQLLAQVAPLAPWLKKPPFSA